MKRKINQKRYKWISVVLTAALLTSNPVVAVPVSAEPLQGNADHNISANTVSANEEKPEIERALTYHDIEDPVPILSGRNEALYVNRETLPSSYSSVDSGKVTSLKDQGSYGSCWAFSAVGACEASLISRGYTGTDVDLSERHLAYYFYEKGATGDLLGGTTGDYNTALIGDYKSLGGNSLFTMWHLVSWAGLVNESAAPYENFGTPLTSSTAENVYGSDTYHLQNAYIINKSNQSTIKQLIMDYGSMAASYYSSSSTSYDKVMDSDYGCYYYNGDASTNHAIQIVGWDDSFSKNNFAITPEGDGAWLVKNSWGEEEVDEDYAQNGYFWLSYYDSGISDNFFTYICEPANNYDNIYQYDGAAGIDRLSVGSAANVYTAGANAGGIEKIEAVGIGNYANGLDYTLSIYKDLTDSSNPSGGTLVSRQTGTLEYSGYHTIILDEPVYVGEGEKFSVVFDFGIVQSLYVDTSYTNGNWLKFTTAESEQTSFYKTGSNDASWSDLVTTTGSTFRIKAYTSNADASEDGALQSIALNKTALTMEIGGTAQLNVSYKPSYTTEDKTVTWSTSNANVAAVDSNGKITAKSTGSAVITATCGTKTATCTVTVKDIKYAIQNVNNGAGTFTVRMARLNELANVAEVRVAVWSAENGQDDLKWYTATSAGNGVYTLNVSIANHGSKAGNYYAHAYVYDSSGKSYFWGGGSCAFTKVNMSASGISAQVSADEETATITMTGVTGVNSLEFAVWSNVNGQDDLIWYTAQNKGSGTWSVSVPISRHRYSAGTYNVHAYAGNVYTSSQFLRATTFKISGPGITKVTAKNANASAGTFYVDIEGVSAKAGVQKMEVAVWSAADQSNLVWYTATKTGDGRYAVPVNIANHGYQYGNYKIHVYCTDRNGAVAVKGTAVSLSQPQSVILATGNATQTQYNIKASNVGYAGGVKSVQVAIWSAKGGQDDLVWYSMKNNGGGVWSVNVPISNHRTAGTYYAHMYIEDAKGNAHFGSSTTFSVDSPAMESVSVQNINAAAGTFTVEVDGATAKSGIAQVEIAVWSTANQSNLKWYTATKQSDGKYVVSADIANHDYLYGTYYIHVYLSDRNGVTAVKGTGVKLSQPIAVVTATGNTGQTQYNIRAGNVVYAGGVRNVEVAVWSAEGGQDDLVWYSMKYYGANTWGINVPIYNHKSKGTYYAHMYLENANGNAFFGGSTTFTVH